jgi:hypothetical protein
VWIPFWKPLCTREKRPSSARLEELD